MSSGRSPLSLRDSPEAAGARSEASRAGRFRSVWRSTHPTVHYWIQTEVHVYAFSVAANLLLSFFPFLIVMLSLFRYVFHWKAAADAVFIALNSYFPDQMGAFISRNLVATVESRGPFQLFSVLLLLFTANGIFEPLEVALNRAWGCSINRSYFKNQLVSLGLIFACGGLVMLSLTLTALNNEYLARIAAPGSLASRLLGGAAFKLAAIPISMLILFLIYWLLPNCKVPLRRILPAAIVVGLLLEALKYVNLLTWSWTRRKLSGEYGPFVYSVTIILWGFFASLVMLAGAEWAARRPAAGIDAANK